MTTEFHEYVYLKYQVYNSLFLTLPFGSIHKTGTLLPLLGMKAEEELEQGRSPFTIVDEFLNDRFPEGDVGVHHDVLFDFIKYVERQVVLFDAIEDAAFDKVNDTEGEGTLGVLLTGQFPDELKATILERLDNYAVRVVMTAHPTQFYPGRILSIISDLDGAIRENDISEINDILLQLGKTPMVQKDKPTPFVEARRLIWYLENVFYIAIARLLEDLSQGLDTKLEELPLEDLIRIGFWPGGDRDGNPFVDAQTTMNVALRLRRTILICYYRDLRSIKRKLTFKHIYSKVEAISGKLSEGIADLEKGYSDHTELLTDLYEVRHELIEQELGLFVPYLDGFIARVRIFGFHFSTIDVRQDSSIHDELMRLVLSSEEGNALDGWDQMDEDTQLESLKTFDPELNIESFESHVVRDVPESMKVMSRVVALNGTKGVERYIISNTQSRLHIMQVYHMMRWSNGSVEFDVTPLFETIDDLAAAPEIMAALYADDVYRQHLEKRGSRQYIMLGFSDGTKDGGYLRANWSIFKAKEEITTVSREAGMEVVFFDGRGGPPARGGGNSHRFYASLGSAVEDLEVQLTVQGQTISSNFGTETSAQFNLEQLFTAGIENGVRASGGPILTTDQRAMIEEMAAVSYEHYLTFKNDPDFLPYLEQLGTLPYYGMTNIGSRPVKRSGNAALTLKSLRAIPFVGSWNQMKQNVPGFYGVGTALEVLEQRGELDKVKALYRDSQLFKALMDNSMMSLTKSYFPLTHHLSDHPKFGRIWKMIYKEYTLTKRLLLEVSGQTELLENSPNGLDSIRLRERIVLPVLVIQQYALQMIRELEKEGKMQEANVYHAMVMRTMFAIINAGRNSA